MGIAMSIVAVTPRQANAQVSFVEWINVGTIRVGSKVFYDSDPFDLNREFADTAAGTCSYGDRVNIPNDKIYMNNDDRGGRRFVVNQNKDPSDRVKCDADGFDVSATNVGNAKITAYRTGDTIFRWDNALSFTKTSTTGQLPPEDGNATNVEIFTRDGQADARCPDIIAHGGGNGIYGNDWFLFPMTQTGTPTANNALSEKYDHLGFQDSLLNCRLAGREVVEDMKLGGRYIRPCTAPDPTVGDCLARGASVGEGVVPGAWPFSVAFGDDAYKFDFGMGGRENAPPSTAQPPPNSGGGGNASEPEKSACEISFTFVDLVSFKWLLCAFINILMATVGFLEDFVVSQLKIPEEPLNSDSPYHKVWSSFRTIALAVIIIVALIMVIFEAAGIEAFSAYTMRTLLTRFGIAVFFIVISWAMMGEVVRLLNGITDGARQLVYTPFNNSFGANKLGLGSEGLIILLGTGGILALGPWGLLSFALSAVISAAILALILIIVHAVFYLLIMVSPLAISLSVLPNTRKGYEVWENATQSLAVGILAIAFILPIIDVVAESTFHLPGNETINQVTALFLKLARFAIVIALLASLRGVFSTITGRIQQGAGGITNGLSNFRKNLMKSRHAERVSGQERVFGSNALTNAYRRTSMIGQHGLDPTARGRARYEANRQKMMLDVTSKMLEQDNGRAANNDDATALALQAGMTARRFLREYQARTGSSEQEARQALATMETSFGARIGTDAMRIAAFRGRTASVTGYNPGDYNQMMSDAGHLVADGIMTTEDAVVAIKANKMRADQSGVGFNAMRNQVITSTQRVRSGVTGAGIVTNDEAQHLRRDALNGSPPGAIVGGRHEAVTALAPEMLTMLNEAVAAGDEVAVSQQLAAIAAKYDAMAQISPQSAEIMAQQVMGQTLLMAPGSPLAARFQEINQQTGQPTGNMMNVQQMVESYRGNAGFQTRRREYTQQAVNQGAAIQAAAQAQLQNPPGGQGQPPLNGLPGQQGSDRRLKRDIRFIGTHTNGVKLYRFKYIWSDQEYVGVMAQDLTETHPEALAVDSYGYYRVHYAKLGMEMYTIEDWQRLQAAEQQTVRTIKSR